MKLLFYATYFGLGTFKYLFINWLAFFHILKVDEIELTFFNLFVPGYLGAVFCMSIFYYSSDFFIKRAIKKRMFLRNKALAEGKLFIEKKKFTRINKTLIKIKQRLGIYAITFLAPHFLSIPGGSIVCAKFYGKRKITFPLMLLFTALYGTLTSLFILHING